MAVSIVGHSLLTASFFLLPILLHEPPEPFDYVAVTVVPPKALGVEDPPEPDPKPREKVKKETPPPPPDPEPKKKEIEPERPVLVEKKPEPKPPPPPPPKPTAEPPPKTAPSPVSPLARPPQRQGNPFGDPLGASTNEATLGVEDPNFTYGYYLDRIVAMISENWNRPVVGGAAKDAVIHFRILRDGTVEDLELRRTSGDETFDRTALGAVRATVPLPPLPSGYKRDFLGINLIVK